MDTRTGAIYQRREGETLQQFAARIDVPSKYLVEVNSMPSGECKKCNGTGAVRRGLLSKRFKPCDCVMK